MIVGDSLEPISLNGLGRWGFPFKKQRRFIRKTVKRFSPRGRARRAFLKSFRAQHPQAWKVVARKVQLMRGRRFRGLEGLSGDVTDLENELELGGLWDDIKSTIKSTAGSFIKSQGDKAALSLGVKQADKGIPPRPTIITIPGVGGVDQKTLLMVGGGLAALLVTMQMMKKK